MLITLHAKDGIPVLCHWPSISNGDQISSESPAWQDLIRILPSGVVMEVADQEWAAGEDGMQVPGSLGEHRSFGPKFLGSPKR